MRMGDVDAVVPNDPATRAQLASRLWRAVPRSRRACWPFHGAVPSWGCGRVRVGVKDALVGRVVWALLYGPIPRGCRVEHVCGRPACVNPTHLVLKGEVAT